MHVALDFCGNSSMKILTSINNLNKPQQKNIQKEHSSRHLMNSLYNSSENHNLNDKGKGGKKKSAFNSTEGCFIELLNF